MDDQHTVGEWIKLGGKKHFVEFPVENDILGIYDAGAVAEVVDTSVEFDEDDPDAGVLARVFKPGTRYGEVQIDFNWPETFSLDEAVFRAAALDLAIKVAGWMDSMKGFVK